MKNKKWWQKAVFYQIYPRSFADSSNNGIGDLQGIIKQLDYLQELGIDAIWLSPIFPSPQEDYGYDVSDYGTINSEYGTMADFDELLEKTHSLGIKIILDMVLNHTSDQHPWFLEARTDRDNPKREWYIWKNGRNKRKKPPNNWKSIIGGSAWEWDKKTQQFYLHQFLPCQPDLNWRNNEVQETMFNYLRFWLDKGIDGFRLDIIHTLFEDSGFRDNPRSWRLLPSANSTAYLFQKPKYTSFLGETINMCTRIRKLIDSYTPERMLVGEATGGPRIFHSLYGKDNDGLNLVFNYKFRDQPFSAKKFKETIQETENILSEPLWPCYFFSNHDKARMISRYRNDEKKSKLLLFLLLTLRGTPFIYYGEELGMHQVKIPKQSLRDPIANLQVMRIPIGKFFGRDGCRTPMQWTSSTRNAGFSSDPNTDPWLPVAKNSPIINVEKQKNDGKSMLTFFKRLIQFRKTKRALTQGSLKFFPVSNRNCLIFERRVETERILVLLNFNKKGIQISNPYPSATKVFSTLNLDISLKTDRLVSLHPFEGLLLSYKGKNNIYAQ